MFDATFVRHLLSATVFAVIGVFFFVLAFAAMVKALPFSVAKEIQDDQNVSLAILIAAVIIGIAIIVGMAIRG
jgi:uncharacterized membrane protein YjfL (UPF0719 family)